MRGMKKLLPAILTVAVVALVGCSREPSSLELANAAAAVAQANGMKYSNGVGINDEAAEKYAAEAAAMYERAKAGK